MGGVHLPVCVVTGLRGGPPIGSVEITEHATIVVITAHPLLVHVDVTSLNSIGHLSDDYGPVRARRSVPHVTPAAANRSGVEMLPCPVEAALTVVSVTAVSPGTGVPVIGKVDPLMSSNTMFIEGNLVPSLPGLGVTPHVTLPVTRPPSGTE